MLQLRQIKKDYPSSGETVHALKGIDLSFRKSEFVAILGPSGCGKTTLLNIIGGLDSYTSGDLVINGRSTKYYSARDWDTYRNHSIGFIFQNYNLIPHQNVLSNVSLSLTLSGVPKAEAKRRATDALAKVGIAEQKRKRPSEMSGGQMQRVAIARAIVNDPDIVLADEPTGALDTATGIQVMEILKEISKDRLVIMVTHNPELAEKYATRTVTVLDGLITGDSDPFDPGTPAEASDAGDWDAVFGSGTGQLSCVADSLPEAASDAVTGSARSEAKKRSAGSRSSEGRKPSMSVFTAFGLSLNNLFTKKGRTMLTSFAGSIGIIGIALIYAVSHGATNYIKTVQEETLTAYPLTLESETVDLGTLIESFIGKAQSVEAHENDAIYQKAMIASLINTMNSIEASENDLTSFKSYLEERIADPDDKTGLREAVSGVQYSYNLNLPIYTENTDGNIILSDVNKLMRESMLKNWSSMTGMNYSSLIGGQSSSMSSSFSTLFQEMLPGKEGEPFSDIFYSQYELIYGDWPKEYDEIVVVVDENNEITDLALYALGLLPEDSVDQIFEAMATGKKLDESRRSWSYEEICSRDYRVVLPYECYSYDSETGTYTDLSLTDSGVRYLYKNALKLKVTGIIRADKDAVTTILNGAVGYTSALTKYIISNAAKSESVMAQLASPDTDIFTGKIFKSVLEGMSVAERAAAYRAESSAADTAEKAERFMKMISVPDETEMNYQIDRTLGSLTREQIEAMVINTVKEEIASVTEEQLKSYIAGMSDDELKEAVRSAFEQQYRENYEKSMQAAYASKTGEELAALFDKAILEMPDEVCAELYNGSVETSSSSLRRNLTLLASIDPEAPSAINIYASTFEDKDTIKDAIADYNKQVGELKEIKYTDYVGIMMSSITTIINAITYVLIAFVAISLFVSSIMIGVITLISVQERTKEIGILRAIGASKLNVSSMFNAETVMIGFASGVIGVGFTYLALIPLNIVLHRLTNINNLSASLPLAVAGLLVLISIMLTLVAGIIPSVSASRKDPVVALRTE
jgi:putative ABC transport system permease protein